MDIIKKFIPTILALLATVIIVRHEINDITSHEWFALDFIDTTISYGLGLLIATPTLIYSVRRLKKTKRSIHYIPLIILSIGTLTTIGLLAFGQIENKSSIILSANYDGDTNGLHLDLRQDGTYRIDNYSVLGGEFLEGTYKTNGDTIFLDKTMPLGDGNDFMANKLIITVDKVLFHLDKNGNYETDYFTMKILDNKLKK